MKDYEFPQVPELEQAYRTAYRALEQLIPGDRFFISEADQGHVFQILQDFSWIAGEAQMTAAALLGPQLGWEMPEVKGDWDLVIAGADLDTSSADFGARLIDGEEWTDSALETAARAYRRECKLDFAPGEGGIWLLMLAPVSGSNCAIRDEDWHYSGPLIGFVILYDRDGDGAYESVGHAWTAQAWRRRGIARRLLAEARSRFAYTTAEGPLTADGRALIEAIREEPGAPAAD